MSVDVVTFGPLALGLLLIAGFGAWVFMHSPRSYLLRWLLIPTVFIVAVLSARVYDLRLGYAVPEALPEKFVYLGHHVVIGHGKKVGIEVWAQVGSTRLYRLAYSKPLEEAMEKAKEQGGKGPVVMHKRGQKRSGSNGEGEEAEPFESNIVLPSEIEPKN